MLPIIEVEVVCLDIVNEVLTTLPRLRWEIAGSIAAVTVIPRLLMMLDLLGDSKVPLPNGAKKQQVEQSNKCKYCGIQPL
jgi:hypothetical protein